MSYYGYETSYRYPRGPGAAGAYYGYGYGAASGGAGPDAYYNPEYYERESGYGFEGTRSSVVDGNEDQFAKKRKVMNVTICVDYIRGFCQKGTRCPKPHVDYVESLADREVVSKLKFCHDFQNQGMCGRRQDCKFLHVTRYEEDEFLLTGTVPQSVFKRMREWNAESSMYNSFGEGPRFGGGRKRPHPDSMSMRGGFMSMRGFGGRGGMRGRGGGPGHTTSQPVTFENYCIDYLKGTCVKSDNCHLKHVETIDSPDERQGIVKQVFCHDFQNDRCKRPFCKYVHATREEESFFLENGYFPPSMNTRNREKLFFSDVCLDFLRNHCIRGASCQYKHVQKIETHSERVCLSRSIFCHDYQEGDCVRPNCKMIHTTAEDERYFLETGLLSSHLGGAGGAAGSYNSTGGSSNAATAALQKKHDDLVSENEALKTRNQQLERLLADACYCMSLAVGDQNPAIAQLMKTITEMAPQSALSQEPGTDGGGIEQSQPGGALTIATSS